MTNTVTDLKTRLLGIGYEQDYVDKLMGGLKKSLNLQDDSEIEGDIVTKVTAYLYTYIGYKNNLDATLEFKAIVTGNSEDVKETCRWAKKYILKDVARLLYAPSSELESLIQELEKATLTGKKSGSLTCDELLGVLEGIYTKDSLEEFSDWAKKGVNFELYQGTQKAFNLIKKPAPSIDNPIKVPPANTMQAVKERLLKALPNGGNERLLEGLQKHLNLQEDEEINAEAKQKISKYLCAYLIIVENGPILTYIITGLNGLGDLHVGCTAEYLILQDVARALYTASPWRTKLLQEILYAYNNNGIGDGKKILDFLESIYTKESLAEFRGCAERALNFELYTGPNDRTLPERCYTSTSLALKIASTGLSTYAVALSIYPLLQGTQVLPQEWNWLAACASAVLMAGGSRVPKQYGGLAFAFGAAGSNLAVWARTGEIRVVPIIVSTVALAVEALALYVDNRDAAPTVAV